MTEQQGTRLIMSKNFANPKTGGWAIQSWRPSEVATETGTEAASFEKDYRKLLVNRSWLGF